MAGTERSGAHDDEREIGIADLATIPIRHWRTVLSIVVVVVGLSAIYVVARTSTYTAETVLVPVVEPGLPRAAAMAGQLPGPFGGMLQQGSSHERLIGAVLRSRSIGDSIVSRMGYVPYDGSRGESELRRIIRHRTRIQTNSDGSIVVQVSDRQPQRAAEIANHIPELANRILGEVIRSGSHRKREFLSVQVDQASEQLEGAERALVAFQQSHELPELQEQAIRTMQAAAELQQKIIEQEIRVSQLQRTATPENPALQAEIAELTAWRRQLTELTSGGGRTNQIFVSLRESPELRSAATRILRDYAAREQIYLSLTGALAEVQMDTQNQLPVVTVLDPAIVPRSPSNRSAVMILGLSAVLGLVGGGVGAVFSELMDRVSRSPGGEGLRNEWSQFKREMTRRTKSQT
jgi:tyrosine-protein kinase Etk/Wzc